MLNRLRKPLQATSQALEKLYETVSPKDYEKQLRPTALLHHLADIHSFSHFNLHQPHRHRGHLRQADALLIHPTLLPQTREQASSAFHAALPPAPFQQP